jgi:hypothetical protein
MSSNRLVIDQDINVAHPAIECSCSSIKEHEFLEFMTIYEYLGIVREPNLLFPINRLR